MAVIIFRCSGCNRLLQLRENEKGVTTAGLCTITEGCTGELLQTDRLQDVSTPLLAENIPDVVNRAPRNVLFDHIQNIVADVWTVTHNLGTNPVVQVAVDRPDQEERIEIEPVLIEIIDKNTTRITFDRNESGLAQFISRSSSSPDGTAIVVAEPTLLQLTASSILTIATLAVEADIGITYLDDVGGTASFVYPITYPPTTESPWSDSVTVVLNGVEYFVGSVDTTGGGVNPSSFYFDGLGAAQPENMFIALALSPFANIDKIKRKVLHPEGISAAEAVSSFAFANGEHFAVDTLIEEVYPPVFIV